MPPRWKHVFGFAVAVAFAWANSWAQEKAETPQPSSEAAAGEKKPEDKSFLRLRRDDKKRPLALETLTATYTFADPSKGEVQVDLIGAVHIGDKAYYETLNKQFEQYDALLYELVAPPNTKIPKGTKSTGSAVGFMQVGMKDMLKLEFQLEQIDYTKENFVHADMSPSEFEQSMKDKGESFTKMFFQAMGYGFAQQGKNMGPTTEVDLLAALFSRDRSYQMKVAFAEQFDTMGGQMKFLEENGGSTILTARNRKALEVLDREIKAGKKKIGIFYGAAHLPDMDARLQKDMGLTRKDEHWLVAWNLERAEKKSKKERAAETKADDEKTRAPGETESQQ
jgi:hypothetical protein